MIRMLSLLFLSCFPALGIAQGFTPEEALKRMQVPDGFQVKLAACEPMIRQPLSISFDERGRMWVLQYLQYPNPAGLKAVKQDQYLRTVWDRVPEPPPKGPKGLDRITICYDPDESGRYRKSKDFVNDLNLATGFCIGQGGVYVVQPPYLLFYADKDHDDVPDGDPEVCLTGFGMEDTHSYANSLQWGPDGWLYGAHGSTVTAKIINPAKPKEPPIEFQQGIWRYHPKTKQFELFSEGGGNTYGLDFDTYGRAIAGTNFGGKAMLHQVQGGYYIKGFAKHGPLHNPHAYGYFDHVPYANFKGGHVTCGGIIYQAEAYPSQYHGQYIAGNLLSNALYWHKLTPQGSSFTAEHGGDFLVANDTWFRPVDCLQGPDGSVYVADWYDKRAAHLDPIDNWDKTNGRIYKVEYKGTPSAGSFDLDKKSGLELVELLKHPNKWQRNEARRLLAEKPASIDMATLEALRQLLENEKDVVALEALWALYVTGNFSEKAANIGLNHSNEHVRSWSVRLLGDDRKVTSGQRERLLQLARNDQSSTVRSQLACTAKRLPAIDGLPIAVALLARTEDAKDLHIPLLIWWAIEEHAIGDQKLLFEQLFGDGGEDREVDKSPIFRDVVLERLAQRYFAENTEAGSRASALLLVRYSQTELASKVLRGMNKALTGRRSEKVVRSADLDAALCNAKLLKNDDFCQMMIRLGSDEVFDLILRRAGDDRLSAPTRLSALEMIGEARRLQSLPLLLDLFENGKTNELRLAALNALQGFVDPRVEEAIISRFPQMTGTLRQRAQAALLSRPSSARAFLKLVETGAINSKDVPVDQLRTLIAFDDAETNARVEKLWGKIAAATPGEKLARINSLNTALGRQKNGDAARGKVLFNKNCAACHTLFGEGGKIGPDLTSADRKNRGYMLAQIVDPSAYIRQEFLAYNLVLVDGRRLSGVIGEATTEAITVLNVVNDQVQKTRVARSSIEEMNASPTSLMPEKLLDSMKDEEVSDLFAYLQAEIPTKKADPKEPAKKLKVLLISGSLEYKSDESLAEWQKHLEANYPVECSRAFRKADDDLPDLEALETCDVAVFFTRRLTIKGEQLERIKKYAISGKPIVGIRTASHGFQNWLDMDKEIFGGDYGNHYKAGTKCDVAIVDAAKNHPVLTAVKPYVSEASLYKNTNVSKDVLVLMTGSIPDHREPIAWVRENKGGRVFYTSLGHPTDFKDQGFVRMISNAVFWTAGRDVPRK